MSHLPITLAFWLTSSIPDGILVAFSDREFVEFVVRLFFLPIYLIALIVVVYPCLIPIIFLLLLPFLFVWLIRTMDHINRHGY